MRRVLDQYFTPTKAVATFLQSIDFEIEGNILEPCVGEGSIVKGLEEQGITPFKTADISNVFNADFHLDMRTRSSWEEVSKDYSIDWTITNPPYTKAIKIIENAYDYSNKGVIALLRLSFLEPCLDRRGFLKDHPPSQVYVTPRIRFTGKGTDTVTTAWMVWDKKHNLNNRIQIL